VGDCALALAHLDLPALIWLCLKLVMFQHASNVQGDLPYVTRQVEGGLLTL
jgi:hypothetical protein